MLTMMVSSEPEASSTPHSAPSTGSLWMDTIVAWLADVRMRRQESCICASDRLHRGPTRTHTHGRTTHVASPHARAHTHTKRRPNTAAALNQVDMPQMVHPVNIASTLHVLGPPSAAAEVVVEEGRSLGI